MTSSESPKKDHIFSSYQESPKFYMQSVYFDIFQECSEIHQGDIP